MNATAITKIVVLYYPTTQALSLFGSHGTEFERPDSDVDLALLLPPSLAQKAGSLALTECQSALVDLLGRPVDLVNLRQVNTVFQFQIVQTGRPIFVADQRAVDEFEMLTLSFYQKLQEERAGILAEIGASKRILDV